MVSSFSHHSLNDYNFVATLNVLTTTVNINIGDVFSFSVSSSIKVLL